MREPDRLDIIDAEFKVLTPPRRSQIQPQSKQFADRSTWPLRDRIIWQMVYWVSVMPVIIAAIWVCRPIYLHFIRAWTAL